MANVSQKVRCGMTRRYWDSPAVALNLSAILVLESVNYIAIFGSGTDLDTVVRYEELLQVL